MGPTAGSDNMATESLLPPSRPYLAIIVIYKRPCRGGIEYFHRSLAGRKRRQKENPVSNETVRYGHELHGTWTRQ
jgi:hypothetical protein